MIGIEACGVYVPLWRLDLGVAREGFRGERAVANFDEDSLTMGVAAGRHCLYDVDKNEIDGLFFASTTFPYKEKLTAVLAATALDLREDIATADFGNSLRAGTTALKAAVDSLKAGSAQRILVIASDMRIPMPGSDFERELGDGAVAVLVSATESKIEIRDHATTAFEMLDVWRTDEDRFVRSWEERFYMEEGYFRVVAGVVGKILEKNGVHAKDVSKAAFYAPSRRRHGQMGRKMGLDAAQIQPPLFGSVGDTGTASSLMLLAGALEEAKAGDTVLLASYGNGGDAFLLKVQEEVRPAPSLTDCISSKRILKDYKRYLNWRGLVEMVTGRRRPPIPTPSASCIWRETEQNIRFHAARCNHCGMVQYPPMRVCFNCRTADQFHSHSLSDKKAILNTYSEDFATPNADPPLVLGVVDFEGGGRTSLYMTDKKEEPIEIGMPVVMTFRKLFTTEGIHNYYWKCTPIRFP